LSDRAEIQSERPVVGAGTAHDLAGHHCRVATVGYKNTIPFRQFVFQMFRQFVFQIMETTMGIRMDDMDAKIQKLKKRTKKLDNTR
jgi:hypothetical protein